jgi:tryptophan-rich sensory protein
MRPLGATTLTFRDIRLGALALAAVGATSVLGQIATYPNLQPWYASLEKPAFNPPNWVFAPVWTSLYLLMAFAFWRILRLPASQTRRTASTLFVVLLVLSAAWSWMFFGAHSPALGFVNIVPQLAITVATFLFFRRIDQLAAACLLPLAAWVSFATVLNFWIWHLNG